MLIKACRFCEHRRSIKQKHFQYEYCQFYRHFTVSEMLFGRNAIIRHGKCPAWTDKGPNQKHVRSIKEALHNNDIVMGLGAG